MEENADQRQQIEQVVVHCMICMQSMLGLNLNKVQIVDKTVFLTVCSQLLTDS